MLHARRPPSPAGSSLSSPFVRAPNSHPRRERGRLQNSARGSPLRSSPDRRRSTNRGYRLIAGRFDVAPIGGMQEQSPRMAGSSTVTFDGRFDERDSPPDSDRPRHNGGRLARQRTRKIDRQSHESKRWIGRCYHRARQQCGGGTPMLCIPAPWAPRGFAGRE